MHLSSHLPQHLAVDWAWLFHACMLCRENDLQDARCSIELLEHSLLRLSSCSCYDGRSVTLCWPEAASNQMLGLALIMSG